MASDIQYGLVVKRTMLNCSFLQLLNAELAFPTSV